jgi:hypothetical protein
VDQLEPHNVEICSSARDFMAMKESSMWQDIVRLLKQHKEDYAEDFDNVDPEDKAEIVRLQTRRQMIDYFLSLPDFLAESIKEVPEGLEPSENI